jgi:hypothetical protein
MTRVTLTFEYVDFYFQMYYKTDFVKLVWSLVNLISYSAFLIKIFLSMFSFSNYQKFRTFT